MRITTKGQVTIPQIIRERFGFYPHTEVDFVEKNGTVAIRKIASRKRGKDIIERMRGKGTVKMSTEEIMSLTREK